MLNTSLNRGLLLAVALSLSSFTYAQQQPVSKDIEGDLSVLVLGSGGPVAGPSARASAGYLVFVRGRPRILMDAGGGTYARLAESGVDIKDLDIVLLSHLHIDHTGDLPAIIKSMYFKNRGANLATGGFPPGRTAPIRIFGPAANGIPFPPQLGVDSRVAQYPATTEYLHDHYDIETGSERYLHLFTRAISGGIFNLTSQDVAPDWTVYHPTTLVDEDGLRITAVGVNHGPVPALAFRIDYQGRSIVYSGDTSSSGDNMIALAQGADLLIYDTAILDDQPAGPNDAFFFGLHTTPTRMGEVATSAGVKHLLLSHITPVSEPALDIVRQTVRAQGFKGKITVAEDLRVLNLDHLPRDSGWQDRRYNARGARQIQVGRE
ncbi:MAG: MBL fold metallo-hydrolase [Pseudomonadota bacterium]